jgi:hypothetical protein
MTFITEIEKSTLKFIWKHKRYHNTDFKLYCKAKAIKQHGTGTKTDLKTSGTE